MELRQLLIDFARATDRGATLSPGKLAALEQDVRSVIWKEWELRDQRKQIPIGINPVVWMRRADAHTRCAPELVRDIENKFDSPEVLDATIKQLNRLLRRGARGAAPRLAQQVLLRLSRGEQNFDPYAIIADAYKYSVSDAIQTARRRNPEPKAPTVRKPRPTGLPDRLVLRHSEAALKGVVARCPQEVAFCIVRDYSRGQVPRDKCVPFEQLKIGHSTVASVLSKIDAVMNAFRAANEGTRRKDPRLTGIRDATLAQILSEVGERFSANSIPALGKRYRLRCEDALCEGGAP